MFNLKRIVATLVGVGITVVNAGPCKPQSLSEAASSTIGVSVSGYTSLVSSATWASTSTVSSDIELATDSATLTQTNDVPTTLAESTVTSAAASATTSVAVDTPCGNQIYRGTASNPGYTSTDAANEVECWESCSSDFECSTWFFQSEGVCQHYRETLAVIGRPKNEDSNLIGSRNCSPRHYIPCSNDIGFGYIAETPTGQVQPVEFEADCAHVCMKDGDCMSWQYDSYSQTCNKFSSYFGDIITPKADASPAQKILLAGSRSCSSDFFKPQLEPCNDQINTVDARDIGGEGYRYFTEFNTVALCARACSIDPMCMSWGVFNGQSDCTLSQNDYANIPTGSSAAGSRNCGVP